MEEIGTELYCMCRITKQSVNVLNRQWLLDVCSTNDV